MDKIKIFKWVVAFQREAKKLSIEYDRIFLNRTLEESYALKLSSATQELVVVIEEHVSTEIRDRLLQTLADTRPEDCG